MILKNKLYEKQEPDRDAKTFIIFCEGKKREPHYFDYFREISSQIRFEIIPAKEEGNNSPKGLYGEACNFLIKSEKNPFPKYERAEEVWFVIDTDSWGGHIKYLQDQCEEQENWSVARSKPCFEVWLYYHLQKKLPKFEGMEVSRNWKQFLDETVKGGFNSRKHSIQIKDAIENSRVNYRQIDGELNLVYTELFQLAERFYPLVRGKIEKARQRSVGK